MVVHGVAHLPRISLARVISKVSSVFSGFRASFQLSPISKTAQSVDATGMVQRSESRAVVLSYPRSRFASLTKRGLVQASPNKSLQRSAGHIKCSAAGGRAFCMRLRRAPACRQGRLAAAELSR